MSQSMRLTTPTEPSARRIDHWCNLLSIWQISNRCYCYWWHCLHGLEGVSLQCLLIFILIRSLLFVVASALAGFFFCTWFQIGEHWIISKTMRSQLKILWNSIRFHVGEIFWIETSFDTYASWDDTQLSISVGNSKWSDLAT